MEAPGLSVFANRRRDYAACVPLTLTFPLMLARIDRDRRSPMFVTLKTNDLLVFVDEDRTVDDHDTRGVSDLQRHDIRRIERRGGSARA